MEAPIDQMATMRPPRRSLDGPNFTPAPPREPSHCASHIATQFAATFSPDWPHRKDAQNFSQLDNGLRYSPEEQQASASLMHLRAGDSLSPLRSEQNHAQSLDDVLNGSRPRLGLDTRVDRQPVHSHSAYPPEDPETNRLPPLGLEVNTYFSRKSVHALDSADHVRSTEPRYGPLGDAHHTHPVGMEGLSLPGLRDMEFRSRQSERPLTPPGLESKDHNHYTVPPTSLANESSGSQQFARTRQLERTQQFERGQQLERGLQPERDQQPERNQQFERDQLFERDQQFERHQYELAHQNHYSAQQSPRSIGPIRTERGPTQRRGPYNDAEPAYFGCIFECEKDVFCRGQILHPRKCTSQFFGRNKNETRLIVPEAWAMSCRKHYQRQNYVHRSSYWKAQLPMLERQLDKFERILGTDLRFHIQGQSKLRKAIVVEDRRVAEAFRSGQISVRPNSDLDEKTRKQIAWMARNRHLCGPNKTTNDVRHFFNEAARACEAGLLEDLPDVEALMKRVGQHTSSPPGMSFLRESNL